MRVLMYGWEFPPFISGGLGVACHAIVQELSRKCSQVNLILPHVLAHESSDPKVNILSCNLRHEDNADQLLAKEHRNISIKKIQGLSLLHPYINASEYQTIFQTASSGLQNLLINNFHFDVATYLQSASEMPLSAMHITGQYGPNLFAEVFYYALLAGKFAAKIPHDVIHAHDWLTVLAGVEAKKRSKKPFVFHVHALEPDRSGMFVDQRIFAIEKYGMEQADHIIAVSGYTKKTIVERYGIPAEKVTVVHNGAYFDHSNLEREVKNTKHKRHKMVLYVGRLAHQKGPDFFLETAKKILHFRKDVHFVFAGTGALFTSLIEKVAAARLGKHIHFTGFLNTKEINRLYKLADVYLMPSVSEPFGLSCLEAISHQVPTVISKQTGVAEVLTQSLQADFWDTDELANKVLALLQHHALRKQFIQQTANDLKKATWDRAANCIVNLYKNLKGGQKHA